LKRNYLKMQKPGKNDFYQYDTKANFIPLLLLKLLI